MTNLVHRANYISTLTEEIKEKAENYSALHQAFVRLAAELLGFENLEEENFIDGAGDRGIDFWYVSDSSMEIFQVKSHELQVNGDLNLSAFDKEGILDLSRIVQVITEENAKLGNSSKLQNLKQTWDYVIARRQIEDLDNKEEQPLQVKIGLVIFGSGLTEPAQYEYESLVKHYHDIYFYKNTPIKFYFAVYNIDDIVEARWRQDNHNWQDRLNRKRDYVELHPHSIDDYIGGLNSAVFYCKAIDLVHAFEDFGYQIFEPNVRAHIAKSKVNAAIKKSLMGDATRKEFHFLNNGITIICKSYSKPTSNRKSFRVIEPGVVNGLQTVVALHEAYKDMSDDERKKTDFEARCFVLVRLLGESAVENVNQVVLASNTQNPMQARNLRSNASEQVTYERLFAELGWFYERKQGAWDAFAASERRWRTLSNFRKAHFQTVNTGGRPRIRRIDNEQVGQSWLCLIGYSENAVHEKRYIFEDDEWYKLAFVYRTKQHGFAYNFETAKAHEEWVNENPSYPLMLVAYLARILAKEAALTSKENEELALKRVKANRADISKAELEVMLAKDNDYLFEQILSGMSFVFVEFLGFILFQAFGESMHYQGFKLLQNGSLRVLKETNDVDTVVFQLRNEDFDQNDLVAVAWHAFRHTISSLMAGTWKQSYQTARNRSRFNVSADTRTRIYNELNELDKFMKKGQLTRTWARGIPPNLGLYNYFSEVL